MEAIMEKRESKNDKIMEYLINAVEKEESWKNNLELDQEVIETIIKTKSSFETMSEHNLEYSQLRTLLLKALNINPKFGDKLIELHQVIDETPEWEQYVSKKTAEVVNYVIESQSTDDAMKHFDMKYTTVRSHLLRALERVSTKKTDFKRYGKSEQATELFDLMDNTPNWKEYVTDNEVFLAEEFKKVRNFYELGRMLDLAPSNIAGTLYGTTQKIGVVGKIKQKLPQTERRDIDGRREAESDVDRR